MVGVSKDDNTVDLSLIMCIVRLRHYVEHKTQPIVTDVLWSVSVSHDCKPYRKVDPIEVPYDIDSNGPNQPCTRWVLGSPRWSSSFGGISQPIVRYREHTVRGRCSQVLFVRWQQWCGLLLSVQQQLVLVVGCFWLNFCVHMCVYNQSWIFRVVQVIWSLQNPLNSGNKLKVIDDNVRERGREQKRFQALIEGRRDAAEITFSMSFVNCLCGQRHFLTVLPSITSSLTVLTVFLQINMNDARYAKYLENIVSNKDLVAFICEDAADVKRFMQQMHTMKLTVNIFHVVQEHSSTFQPQHTVDRYK